MNLSTSFSTGLGAKGTILITFSFYVVCYIVLVINTPSISGFHFQLDNL